MALFKSKWTQMTIKLLLFFFLVLLTLVVLLLSNSVWFPLSIASPVSHIQRVIHNFSIIAKVNELYRDKSHIGSRNVPFTGINVTTGFNWIPKPPLQYEYIINEPDKCKEDSPFLVLLITVERWQQEARQAIRNTWGKEDLLPGVKILRLFFIGKDPNLNDDSKKAILKESEEFHDIIQQDYLDTYKNLTIKVLMGFKWITTYCPDTLYIMKTDSDMFVNTEYLVKELLKPDQAPKTKYFTGYLMINGSPIRNLDSKWYVSPDVYPEEKYPSFCSGTGYVLSGDLSHKIVKVSPSIRWIHLEDVYIGLCLDKVGVQPVAPPKSSDFNSWRVMYSDCGYHRIVTSHGVSPGELLHYWNRVQKNKHQCG